jgi:hypothetical protein
MEKTAKVIESSDLYRKINALGLPAMHRQRALASAEVVERLAYAIERILKLLKVEPAAPAAPSRSLRHQ